jgi:ribosome maturation factor RimP
MSFWKRTLQIFKSDTVRIELRAGLRANGDIVEVGETSCTIKKVDGSTQDIPFAEIISVQPGVPKL